MGGQGRVASELALRPSSESPRRRAGVILAVPSAWCGMMERQSSGADGAMLRREREAYDRVARRYSANSRGQGARREAILRAAALEPGQAVLDVCTGPGWLAIEAARLVAPGGRVVAVDLSPRMCEVALENAREAGLGA